MKKEYKVTHCEYCDSIIKICSPPSKLRYENAEIYIRDGSILLPKNIVKANHKKGYANSHATNLNGYYCTYKCLIKKIKQILKKI